MNILKPSLTAAALFASAFCAQAETFLVEAEAFQFLGDWSNEGAHGQRMITAQTSTKSQPTTVVDVAEGGKCAVWANGRDYEKMAPATRRFAVSVNGRELPNQGGTHGREGLYWQKMGEIDIPKGENILSIVPKTSHMRIDAIVITNDLAYDPNAAIKNNADRAKIRRAPMVVECTYDSFMPMPEALKEVKGAKTFGISNASSRIVFTERQNAKGEKSYVRSAQVLVNGKWEKLSEFKDEALYLIYSQKPGYVEGFYITWLSSNGVIKAHLKKGEVDIVMPPINPYAIGEGTLLKLKGVKKVDEKTLELAYSANVKAKLTMLEKGGAYKMEIEAPAEKEGFYSFCFLSSNAFNESEITATEIPTIYQGSRTMSQPKLVANRMTSHPLSLIETSDNGIKIVNGVVADPANLPFGEWSEHGSSRYGFSLANPENAVQAAIFQPILGGRDSQKKEGDTIKASWYVMNIAGTWMDALELSSEKIFDTTALREAYEVSFSDGVANIAAYMKNEDASGWSRLHKARWNIEAADTGTQSSPLSELSIAILTDDEDYYRNIALPSIEFTISRGQPHFAPGRKIHGTWFSNAMTKLTVPSYTWGGDYFASVNRMLGMANPFFKEFYSNKGTLPADRHWTNLVGLYLADPTPELLEQAKAACDAWLARAFDPANHKEMDMINFINFGDYPYWWYLPEMYEITKDKKYLEYAEKGAFHSLSSLWCYPTVPAGEWTINRGNLVRGVGHVWWKGIEEYRLGYDTNKARIELLKKNPDFAKIANDIFVVPEKKVDAMKVSRIGLGIEQHTTFLQGTGDNNILMPSWSAEMLKVYQRTKRDVLLKYSRHAIVGRYSNFLGYYIRDYTDVQHDPDYPYAGPDTTSVYYHHAPCHFGQSMDYLMTQIEVASNDKISFPYVRQQGYVWFTDRIFGQVGKVFGESAKPMLSKTAIRPDSVKVSTFMARSKDGIWGVLLNDSGKDMDVAVSFDASAKAMKGAKTGEAVSVYDASGRQLADKLTVFGGGTVKIPAMSLVAVRIPAAETDVEKAAQPIAGKAHFEQKNIGEGWGDLHFFRIRGPFGKDSIYVVLTDGAEKKNAKATLNIEEPSRQSLSVAEYPFEFSVYPLDMDKNIKVSVTLEEEGKAALKSEAIVLEK